MIGGELLEKVRRAVVNARYDDAVVVIQERASIGAEAQYRSIEQVFYDSHNNMIVVVVGSEKVSRAAVGQGWRPNA